MKKIKAQSPAKINLTLEVIKKLPNGFHELRTVMLKTKNLFDEIEIIFAENKTGIEIVCDNPAVPKDEKNICWKIAEQFFKATKQRVGLIIKIKKNIPLASGMGGGSSNGAVVILALNAYYKNILSEKKLVELASAVGKDIPFFISTATVAYISGMGEKIKPLKKFPRLNILLINPAGEISTPWAYSQLDQDLIFMNDLNRKNISQAFIKNNCLYNDFSIIAKKKYPEIETLEKALLTFGAIGTSISGKGPTVFGIFSTKKATLQAKNILKKYYPQFFIELA
jgi:4-diphosphocytidyl-2-C-methyl-D-erythritol kinase